MIISFVGCTKEELPSDKNGLLKEVLSAGSVIERYTYNENNLLSEANSTYFWMKYYYNNKVLPSFRPLINKYKFSYYDDVIQCYITGNNSQSYSGY